MVTEGHLAQFYWSYPDGSESQMAVLERDNYTCQDCGYRPRPKKVLIAYCGKCAEQGVLFKPVEEWGMGMLRPDFANYPPPTFTPVRCKFSDAQKCVECSFYREIEVVIPPLVVKLPEGLAVRIGCKELREPRPSGFRTRYRTQMSSPPVLQVYHSPHPVAKDDNISKLSLDPANLVTLCSRCHGQRMRKRGDV